ncbi:hypothetical protein [Bacillus weihaiensis]|uniref:Uncharacterized protein n=1 Tax=Bacillus weihaiensis TaxID=1547283 RepID=A0A1L3MW99_9BACI|nr:hypothetical protein [Bacillus weihaiensis]APH06619.1 hypothetical protein A9C19_19015 [Bacillus weihaiensis]
MLKLEKRHCPYCKNIEAHNQFHEFFFVKTEQAHSGTVFVFNCCGCKSYYERIEEKLMKKSFDQGDATFPRVYK